MKFEIIYEDQDIVAVNKPSGLLSIPDRYKADIPCLYHEVALRYDELYVVHRLDRDTSGIILFARNAASHKYFSQLFEGRDVSKYYLALVNGKPVKTAGTIIAPIAEHPNHKGRMSVQKKGRFAHTDYQLEKYWNSFSLLRLQIFTGRTHQIRVHMQHLGTPVVADPFYGDGKGIYLSSFKKKFKLSEDKEEEQPLIGRLALHAHRLLFTNAQGQKMELEAPLPRDMAVAIKQMDKWGSGS